MYHTNTQPMDKENKSLLFRFLEILCEQDIDYIRQNFKDFIVIQFFETRNNHNCVKTSFTFWNNQPDHMAVNTEIGLSMCATTKIAKEDLLNSEDPMELINDHIMCNCDRLKEIIYQHAKLNKR